MPLPVQLARPANRTSNLSIVALAYFSGTYCGVFTIIVLRYVTLCYVIYVIVVHVLVNTCVSVCIYTPSLLYIFSE